MATSGDDPMAIDNGFSRPENPSTRCIRLTSAHSLHADQPFLLADREQSDERQRPAGHVRPHAAVA